ncbi:3-methyl-2-oxobutanoate dehydrogenase subunit alpha [soil metagenome]
MQDKSEDSSEASHIARRGTRVQSGPPTVVRSGRYSISVELALTIFRQMVRTRALEERSIKMSKSGEAYFWIGGPGEEAFNVCLGMQIKRGQGPDFDYLHLHYRNAGCMLALGMDPADHLRQLAMTATDPHSRGRNFVGHYAVPAWNVLPVTSVIEVQYVMAIGTAHVQKRHGGEGLTVVVGGDAGTAEGDFESCLLWSNRPGNELPTFITVTNNHWGISTQAESQLGARNVSDRAKPYPATKYETVDCNDPIACWHAIARAMQYCRVERKPFLLEALVSRLHGHSSSSGAQRNFSEVDCVAQFEQKLIDAGAIDAEHVRLMKEEAKKEIDDAVALVVGEPKPMANEILDGVYAASGHDAVYPNDYTGLPARR